MGDQETEKRDGMTDNSASVLPTPHEGLGPLARTLAILGVISLVYMIFIFAVPIDPWFPEGTRQAGEVDFIFRFMLAFGGAIIIYVQGLLITFVRTYRQHPDEAPDALGVQSHGNTRLEIAWTIGPTILVIALLAISFTVRADEIGPQKNPLQLYVHGYQFAFGFQLHQYGLTSDMSSVYLPINRPVYVSERSTDVIHSFWVPEFRIKEDIVPLANGGTTHEEFTPTRIGVYRVICTEYCGSGHSSMHIEDGIHVVSEKDFEAWVRSKGGVVPSHGVTTALLSHPTR